MKQVVRLNYILIILAGLQTQLLFAGLASGYMVSHKGDTSFVTIKVRLAAFSKEIAWIKMQEEVSYMDTKNTPGIFMATDVKEYGFTYNGKKYKYVNVPVSTTDFLMSKFLFMRLDQDGYCKVYTYFFRSLLFGLIKVYERPVLQKGSDAGCFVALKKTDKVAGIDGVGAKQYLSDCPLLIKKLDEGALTIFDPFGMANVYNQNCVKK